MTHRSQPSRRDFVITAAAATAALGCQSRIPGQPDRSAAELVELGAAEAVGMMTRGELTAERYATALLERCQAGKRLNAFITLDPDRVLAQAREADRKRAAGGPLGRLHGLPIPIKDSVNTKDYPTTGGTRALEKFIPGADAPIVQALVGAGAIVLGKTNIHELSLGWTSSNQAFGAVGNPYDFTRIAGGSSGGTGAAVGFRMAPLGVAEDTEGSIRVPASLCGVVGFRPTTGRYPSTGVIPISPLFDQVGPHARSVTDVVLFDDVVLGSAEPISPLPLRGVRLGVSRGYFFAELDPEVERVTNQALARLVDAGVELVEVELADVTRLVGLSTDQVQLHDFRPAVSAYLAEFKTGLTYEQVAAATSSDIKRVLDLIAPGARYFIPEAAYVAARDVHIPRLQQTYRSYFADNRLAALIFPATRIPAAPIGATETVEIAGRAIPFTAAISRNIAPGSTAGVPGLVLPAGLTAGGLPVALELDGPAGTDRSHLALGLAIEHVLGKLPGPKAA
jgi:mandelamide amidase